MELDFICKIIQKQSDNTYTHKGTCFFIDEKTAITAKHVLQEENLYIDLGNGTEPIRFQEKCHKEFDFAIIKLFKTIVLNSYCDLNAININGGENWETFGFPGSKEHNGEIIYGVVSIPETRNETLYDIDLKMIPDSKLREYRGISGAPVIIDNTVQAIIIKKPDGVSFGGVKIQKCIEFLKENNVKYKQSIIKSFHYKALLKNYINDIFLYSENNNKENESKNVFLESFSSEIKLFKECLNKPNKKILVNKLKKLLINISYKYGIDCDEYRKIEELIKYISKTVQYELIIQEINGAIKHLDNSTLLSEIRDILKQILKRVLLITGEPGSGKTHFVKEYLSSFLKEDKCSSIVLPINWRVFYELDTNKFTQIEQIIIERINEFTEKNFNNFNDFNNYIQKVPEFNLHIVIDDIQILYFAKPNIFEKLINYIIDSIKYEYISWIITVNEFDIYIFEDNLNRNDFLNKYCIQSIDISKTIYTKYQYDFNLTEYNNKNNIGEKILKQYENFSYHILNIDKINEEGTVRYTTINNPLFAHVIGQTNSEPSIILWNGYYYEFIKSLIEYINNAIINRSIRNDISRNEATKVINFELDKLLGDVYNNNQIRFLSEKLKELCTDNLLFELKSVHLLQRISSGICDDLFSNNFMTEEIIYKLYFTTFWSFRLFIYSKKQIQNDEFYEYVNLLKKYRFSPYKNELITYCLLFFSERNFTEKFTDIVKEELCRNNEIHIALFSSLKLNENFKFILLDILLKENLELNKAESFSLLYFADNIKTSINKKFKLIEHYSKYIDENRLYSLFEVIFKRIVAFSSKIKDFKKDIISLIPCQGIKINILIGKICADKYFELSTCKSVDDEIENLIKFVYSISQNVCKIYDYNKEQNNEINNNTFFDWFLRGCFWQLFKKYTLLEVYNNMEKNDYFFTNNQIDSSIRINFTCAAGNIYSSYIDSGYKNEYLKVIDFIIKKGIDSRKNLTKRYIFAYHFITNSLNDDMNEDEFVDEIFIEYLEKINNNKNLKDFCFKRKKFFNRNLNYWKRNIIR